MPRTRSHHSIFAWIQPSTLASVAALAGIAVTGTAAAQSPAPQPSRRKPTAPAGWEIPATRAAEPAGAEAPATRQRTPVKTPAAGSGSIQSGPKPAVPPSDTTAVEPIAGTPDGTATFTVPPKAEEEERAATLADQANLNGSVGLLHTAYAGSGARGTFRVGFLADLYSGSGFLCNAGTPCEPTSTADDSSHVGGWFTVNATPLSFLEAYAGIRTYANSNSLGAPSLLQVLGDTTLGVKAFTPSRIGNVLTVGGDFRLLLLNGAGDVGVASGGTSAELNLLSSLDFRKLKGRGVGAPVRMHINVGYKIDNSGNIVEGVETIRAARNPSLSGGLDRIPISRIERFGLGINRVDFMPIRFGIDGQFRWIQPYAEFSLDIPVNRQGYACHTRTISEGDVCLALTDLADPLSGAPGFAAAPSRVTLGARLNPFNDAFRGLSGHVALDIGTSGTSKFIEEVAPQAPWGLYLGMGYAYDTQPKKVPLPLPIAPVAPVAPVAAVAPIQPPEVVPPAAEYFIRGTVKEKGAVTLIAKAIVTLRDPGANEPPYATDASGRFLTRKLEPGSHAFEVSADGYNTATCVGTITAALPAAGLPAAGLPATVPPVLGAQPTPEVPSTPKAPAVPVPAPKQYVTGSYFSDVSCELESLPKKGGLSGAVTNAADAAALTGATITLTDAAGVTTKTTSESSGVFKFGELTPGDRTLSAEQPGFFPHTQDVTIRAREDVKASIALTKRPAQSSVKVTADQIQISKQIHFETDSAVILGDSTQLLAEIADVINKNEKLRKIEIQGHTDNTGAPSRNKELSQMRADSVLKWLVGKGAVANERLSSKGFGQERPLVPNVTPANRARNRRVQFIFVKP